MPLALFAPALMAAMLTTLGAMLFLMLNARSVAVLYALRPGPGPVRAGRRATLAAVWAFALGSGAWAGLSLGVAAGLVA